VIGGNIQYNDQVSPMILWIAVRFLVTDIKFQKSGKTAGTAGTADIGGNTNSLPPESPVQANEDINPGLSGLHQPHQDGTGQYFHPLQALGNGLGFGMNDGTGFAQMGWHGPSEYNQMMSFMPSGVASSGMTPFQSQMGKLTLLHYLPFRLFWIQLMSACRWSRDVWNGDGSDGCVSGYVWRLRDEHE
jgi:hypothetical protein